MAYYAAASESLCYYLSPIFDFGLCNVLDGHLEAVAITYTGVDDAEASLAQDVADFVGFFEGLARHRAGWGWGYDHHP